MARKKSTTVEMDTPRVTRKAPPDTGPDSAGQSGDLQGLSGEETENESVRELLEEGQFYEASVVEGVENAPSPEEGPLRVHKRREDDLPPEYTGQPPDEPKE